MRRGLKNTVEVRICGLGTERFLNAAMKIGVVFYDVKRVAAKELRATIDVEQIKKLRRPVRISGCKIFFHNKKGPRFAMRRAAGRWMLPVGLLFCALLIWQLGGRIWLVQVEGNEALSRQEVMQILDSRGVKIGMVKNWETLKAAQEDILVNENAFSYVGLKMKGVKLIAKVVEAKASPKVYDPDRLCDVVAAYDAVVQSIRVFKGTAMVKPGDTVRAGQILIAGEEDGQSICALGEVSGTIWYSASANAPLSLPVEQRTGRESRVRHLLTPFCILTLEEGEELEAFQTELLEYPILDGLFLDVRVVTQKRYEVETILQSVDYETARETAADTAMAQLAVRLPFGIIPDSVTLSYSLLAPENSVKAVATAQIQREIGKERFYDE